GNMYGSSGVFARSEVGQLVVGLLVLGTTAVVSPPLQAQKLLATIPLPGKQHVIRGVAFSPDGHTLAVRTQLLLKAATVAFYNVEARKRLGHIVPGGAGIPAGVLAFTSDSKTLITSSDIPDKTVASNVPAKRKWLIEVWDLKTRKRL